MPGKASLAARQYYAHPRNAFWPIVERLHGVPADSPYEQRTRALAKAGVALWDVLAHCCRESSLDSDIELPSAQPNDLAGFLAGHPQIRLICFNGQPAQRLFERLVLPELGNDHRAIMRLTLPSTSPANARLSLEMKLEAWKALVSPG